MFRFGRFTTGNGDINFLSINAADNVLHLRTGLASPAAARSDAAPVA
jgi:hypothetical protein